MALPRMSHQPADSQFHDAARQFPHLCHREEGDTKEWQDEVAAPHEMGGNEIG